MKIQVGVMGSAGGPLTDDELALSRRLGKRIAERNCVIVTGACPGLPHAAVLGATEAGGISFGVSPALSREEHVNVYGSPLEPYTIIAFTGSGLMGRETYNIHSSDFVLFVGGRSGTLGEFCIAYDEGKLIGVLTNSGGISNQYAGIAEMVKKQTGSIILTNDNPEALVDECLDKYCSDQLPMAKVFDRDAVGATPTTTVRITQETRG